MQIDKNVDAPQDSGVGRPRKYPFHDMEVGDSFIYDEEDYSIDVCRKISAAANFYGKSMGKKFSLRKDGDYIRIWRVK